MKKRQLIGFSILAAVTITLNATNFLARGSEIFEPSEQLLTLRDPLFGIPYRPSEVHFEKAPDTIYNCKDLKTRRGSLFLFGKAQEDKRIFYYVYGWVEVVVD